MSQAAPAPVPPPPPNAPDALGDDAGMPKRFGKYTLIRRLALGGMAELFLALQRSVAGFEKIIVVKRVLPNLAQDQSFIEMLLAEARIAATLNHPNVAHIYDVGEVDGQFYIAMEHIHGEDLRSLVRQMKNKNVTAFPLEHALAIVLGSCAGLAYAHDKRDLDGEPMGIVHRDVSPQNILVTFGGDVKLVDFGIAKAGRSTMEDTDGGQLKGKVPYMSPEQAQGLPLDSRSDIFSLGIILHELCTGRRLFRGKNEMETLRRIVEDEYPRPRELNPSLHPRLEEIILRSLEKDPARRYQSARDMQGDLEDFIRSEQLKVSSISLGAWMEDLFAEKIHQQKQMLAEGRQLAEVLALQAEGEERDATFGTLASGVRAKPASKLPWIVMAVVVLLGLAAGGYFLTRPPDSGVATGPGVLTLESTPPGAAIWLNGNPRPERTPATLRELPIGEYDVRLTLDGYAPFDQHAALTGAEPASTIRAALARPSASNFAVINVRTVPAGARVLLDGRDTQLRTPATVPEVTPGETHTLALALDGYVTRNETLTLEAGQVRDLNLELERTPLAQGESILRITTDPMNARVQLDGQWHESGSPYEFRMPTRRVRVVVQRAGFRSAEREVELASAQVSELTIDLERDRRRPGAPAQPEGPSPPVSNEPGRLTLDASPWCNVTLDGRSLGQTPVVNQTVAPGRHTIVCTNPQAGSQTVTINVAPGQVVRRRLTLSP